MKTIVWRLMLPLAMGGPAWAANLNREIVLTPHAGGAAEDREIVRWQMKANESGARREAFERLAWAYVAKARRTLDSGYYVLAEKTAEVIEAEHGASAEARLIRGHAAHQLHRFRVAETLARQLVAERGSAADLGLLSDVLVDQGNLAEAVGVLQRLASVRPGLAAFSRIAHVRWLKGDIEGARAAYQEAWRATDARDSESQAWLLTRLSFLELQRGEIAAAHRLADLAVQKVSAYPPGLFARGRAALARNDSAAAIEDLQRAAASQPSPEIDWWLADALALAGRREEAHAVERRLRERGATDDPRTLALFLATRGEELPRALRLAQAELRERADVFSHDALAWAALATGDDALAQERGRSAAAEGTRDARLLLHAGELARRRGEAGAAQRAFAAARAMAATLTPSERAWLERAATTAEQRTEE